MRVSQWPQWPRRLEKIGKRKRHSAEQIVGKLQDADRLLNAGQSVEQVYQALGISEATYHRWRNKYGGLTCEEAKRLKELEVENTRLKKLLADSMLDNAMLKDLAEGNF